MKAQKHNYDYSLFRTWEIFFHRYDGRRKNTIFCGMTKEEFRAANDRHNNHAFMRYSLEYSQITNIQRYKETLKYFAEIPKLQDFKGDGLSDWERFKELIPNGVRAVCPGERGNNYTLLPDAEYKIQAIKHIKRTWND